MMMMTTTTMTASMAQTPTPTSNTAVKKPVITTLKPIVVAADNKKFNPTQFNTSPSSARFFIIKSFSEDDVHKSIKVYNRKKAFVWLVVVLF
jgi:hypothetical protein